ncbi:MAG: alpha-1,4 glucan phosphorylase [Nitrosospira sp.]
MTDQTRAKQLYSLHPVPDLEGYDSLAELALDMRTSWNHSADHIWEQLESALWKLTRNPWVVLQTVSQEKLEQCLADPAFSANLADLVQDRRDTLAAPTWFEQNHPQAPLKCVAYFCMEFMLSEALPIYSGGLGNVAGDQLKTASELGVPVIGIGLLYQQGYFRQVIGKDGEQQALFPYNDPGQLPITPLRRANGEWLRLEFRLPGYSLWLRTWQVQVGKTTLYLLDSNDAANYPAYRGITSELYGGGPELRLQQEIVLGIGGWQLLAELGIKPEVCHLNEGHAAFAVLERAWSCMRETGHDFRTALAITRAGNLFTTHTAVAAGFDRFAPELIEHYLGDYATRKLGISCRELLALGRRNADDASEPFNMAYLAMSGSAAVNAVSCLHGRVSRHLFGSFFPHWPINEVPVGHVTNGVHVPTWDSAAADRLWTEVCGKDRWIDTTEPLEPKILNMSDADLWQFRCDSSKKLVEFVRRELSVQLAVGGAPSEAIEAARGLLDPDALTLGFARRFATYKRPDLLLHDRERLLGLLSNPRRRVQLIMAGKAHPADEAGKALIREWVDFIRHTGARASITFLSDYDMHLTEQLVQGVDVWLNTPRRPWEACGTSGMKVLVNGGINLSVLDGWWAEAYTPEVGWALGDGKEHGDDPAWDAFEADQLYDLLEQQVIPEFYTRDQQGIPTAWVTRMRKSMAQLTPRFAASRAVREYTERHYLPSASAYLKRSADNGALGARIAGWQSELRQKWGGLHFGDASVETEGGQHVFVVHAYLNGLDPEAVRVELYAEEVPGDAPVRLEMQRMHRLVAAATGYAYVAHVPGERPASDYTARLIPRHDDICIPLEASQILWQR